MHEVIFQVFDLLKVLIYSGSLIYTIKLIRSKKTKKLNIKFKNISITTEYFDK